MRKVLTIGILSLTTLLATPQVEAYTQKAPYQGYGQPSKVNGMPKTKPISGYTKKSSTGGYVRVNPYYRSKA